MIESDKSNITPYESLLPIEKAQQSIISTYQGVLPDEVVTYWTERSSTWEPQISSLSLSDWMSRIGNVPNHQFDLSKIKPQKPVGVVPKIQNSIQPGNY